MHNRWDHPADSRGADLQRSDWCWQFSDAELAELLELCEASPDDHAEIESLPPIDDASPARRSRMLAIQDALEHGTGAVMLKGFPIDDLASTRSAATFWRLLRVVGTPVPQTASGQRLFKVQDEGFDKGHPAARGPSSRSRLSFHTDRCDVIGFLCVRQAPDGGENQIVSSMAIYNRILEERPDLLKVLCEPFYYRRHNVDPGNEFAFYAQPVFTSHKGRFAASLLRVLIERAYQDAAIGPMSSQQRAALDYFESVADDPSMHLQFRQLPGDIVLLNNFVTMHRRNAFRDPADGESKRLLWRLWLAVPNSRPLDPSFAASYGATAAGAIRGGMRPL